MKKILTLILTLCIIAGGMAQGTLLSLNLEKDKVYTWNSESTTIVDQNASGQSINMTMTTYSSMKFRVDAMDFAGYDMTVWYETLRVSMKGAGIHEMTSDSEGIDTDNPLSSAMKIMTNKPFNIRLARNGTIISVSGTDVMMEKVTDDMASKFPDVTPEEIEQMKAMLTQAYGENTFKIGLGSGMVIMPETPVSPGDSWTNNTLIQSMYSIDVETVYTLVDKTPEGLLIKSESTLTPDNNAEAININGMSLKYEIKGAMTSETVIDPFSGWIVSGRMLQEMSGTMEISGMEEMPEGLSIPIGMKTDMTITSK